MRTLAEIGDRAHAARMKEMPRTSSIDVEAAGRYRQRAVELRQIAETMSDPKSRYILQTIADDYDRMAMTREAIDRTESVLKP